VTSRVSLWAPVVAYMTVIFVLSSIPRPPEPPEALSFLSDKALHAMLYAGLAVLIVRALSGGWLRSFTVGTALLAVAIAVAYGISDEIHQYFVPLRTMDVGDVIADAVGAALAVWGLYVVGRQRI
jgi:VanZ family protein